MKISKSGSIFLLIIAILIADQSLKFWIKTNMALGDEYRIIGNWFIIHFVENNGMAFGFEFAGAYGKLFLSLFRIVAVVGIGWYLIHLLKKNLPIGFLISIALIFTGAMGNIIDSVFYGVIFDHSYGQIASLFPEGGGYSSLMYGKVVDMFYFPIINGFYPDWVPLLGGREFVFFRPVFNIADSSITLGIFSILLFYRKQFDQLAHSNVEKSEEIAEPDSIQVEESDSHADESQPTAEESTNTI